MEHEAPDKRGTAPEGSQKPRLIVLGQHQTINNFHAISVALVKVF